jgi:fibro-slime domain-containing protein
VNRFSLVLGLSLTGACGSRTPLAADPDICDEPGALLDCSTPCGGGTRTCSGGRWQPCDVAIVHRTCTNDCGRGEQACADGAWSTCNVPIAMRACSTLCGVGQETCMDGKWQNCDAPRPMAPKLKATVRDFQDTHPDFERPTGSFLDTGIVEPTLGPDDKPVYAGNPTTPTTSGKAFFDEWYRDTPGVNLTTTITIPLTPSPDRPATLVYDNGAFFPIDDQLFGNQGRIHNYHFTLEVGVTFRYDGGETFRFTGDDDLWVFVNRRLAINLGGLHASLGELVDLDARSQELGIAKGGAYPLHVFFAERHTSASTFHVETTVAEWDACE